MVFHEKLSSLLVLCVAVCWQSPAAAEAPEAGVRAMVAPIIGQSMFQLSGPSMGVRTELGGDVALGRFESWFGVGFTYARRRPLSVFSQLRSFVNPNCVDPVRQACVGPSSEAESHVHVADTHIGAGVRAVDGPTLTVIPRLDLVLPTSAVSRWRSLILRAQVGADVELRALERLRAIARVRLERSAHINKFAVNRSGTIRGSGEFVPPYLPFGFLAAGSRLPGREVVELGYANTAWALHVGVEPRMVVASDVWVDIGLGLTTAWTYSLPAEPFGEPGADASRAVERRTTATLGIAWRPTFGMLELEVRLGAETTGDPKTADGQSDRFPWWHSGAVTAATADASVLELRIGGRLALTPPG